MNGDSVVVVVDGGNEVILFAIEIRHRWVAVVVVAAVKLNRTAMM